MLLQITSSAFSEGEMIPIRYTCDGPDVSPDLTWSGVPEKARSLALMEQASGSPGWQETRKLADQVFGAVTAPLMGDPDEQAAHVLLNASHLLPHVDALIRALNRMRDWITTDDTDALRQAFDQATSVRTRGLADRADGQWDEELAELGIKGTLGSMGDMLGFGLGSRKPREDKNS